MTPREGHPGEQPQLDGYDVISRARDEVPRLATVSLDRIRGLLERALAGESAADEVLAELAKTLDHGA